jgi:hypothetical protein
MAFVPSADRQSEEPREFQRRPLTCLAAALLLSAVFWIGLIWAAVRLYH